MKRIVLIATLLFWATSAFATLAFTNRSSGNVTPGTTLAIAYGSNNTAGNTLVAVVGYNSTVSGVPAITITDSAGDTWYYVGQSPYLTGANNSTAFVYEAFNCVGGANTVTIHYGVSTYSQVILLEGSGGLILTDPADAFTSNGNKGGTSSLGTGSTWISTSSQLVLVYGFDASNSGDTFTFSGGFTQIGATESGAGGTLAVASQVASSAGSFSSTVGISNSSAGFYVGLVSFTAISFSAPHLAQPTFTTQLLTAGTSLTAAYPRNNTAGCFLFVVVNYPNGFTATSVADSYSEAFIPVPVLLNPDSVTSQAYYFPNCHGGANTITATTSGSQTISVTVAEYSGVSATAPFITASGKIAPSGTSVFSDYVTVGGPALILGYAFNNRNTSGVSFSPSSNYVTHGYYSGTAANFQGILFDQVATAGPYSATATAGVSGSGNDLVVGLIGFSTTTVTTPYRRQAQNALGGNGSTTSIITMPRNTLSSSQITVAATCDASGTWGISDNLSNIWNLREGGPGKDYAVWDCLSCSSGAEVITVTNSGGTFLGSAAVEYVGINSFDSGNSASGTGTSQGTGSITTAHATEITVSTGETQTTNDTDMAGASPWSHVARIRVHDNFLSIFDQIVSSTGTYSNTVSMEDGGSYTWATSIEGYYSSLVSGGMFPVVY